MPDIPSNLERPLGPSDPPDPTDRRIRTALGALDPSGGLQPGPAALSGVQRTASTIHRRTQARYGVVAGALGVLAVALIGFGATRNRADTVVIPPVGSSSITTVAPVPDASSSSSSGSRTETMTVVVDGESAAPGAADLQKTYVLPAGFVAFDVALDPDGTSVWVGGTSREADPLAPALLHVDRETGTVLASFLPGRSARQVEVVDGTIVVLVPGTINEARSQIVAMEPGAAAPRTVVEQLPGDGSIAMAARAGSVAVASLDGWISRHELPSGRELWKKEPAPEDPSGPPRTAVPSIVALPQSGYWYADRGVVHHIGDDGSELDAGTVEDGSGAEVQVAGSGSSLWVARVGATLGGHPVVPFNGTTLEIGPAVILDRPVEPLGMVVADEGVFVVWGRDEDTESTLLRSSGQPHPPFAGRMVLVADGLGWAIDGDGGSILVYDTAPLTMPSSS